jgi:hypothetical protein
MRRSKDLLARLWMPVTITRLRLGTVPVLAGGVRCCHRDRSKPWMGIAMAPLFGFVNWQKQFEDDLKSNIQVKSSGRKEIITQAGIMCALGYWRGTKKDQAPFCLAYCSTSEPDTERYGPRFSISRAIAR